jgi:hypothetical protein
MYIKLFGSSDRLGGNIIDMISQIIYCVNNNIYIEYDRINVRVVESYNQHYNSSIFMQTLFDIIDKHNLTIIDKSSNEYVELAAPSHFEVLTRTTLNVKEDLFTFFKKNLYTKDIREEFMNKAKARNYEIPFDPKKTILIHHRLEDVRGRPDYDGSVCADYMKILIESDIIPGNEILSSPIIPASCLMQAPLSLEKITKVVNDILQYKPDHEVIIVTTPNENISNFPYRCISNDDEYYDLFLLCNSETLILSRSNFSLSSLFFGISKEVHAAMWGILPCYGLYTKYDKTDFKYFI